MKVFHSHPALLAQGVIASLGSNKLDDCHVLYVSRYPMNKTGSTQVGTTLLAVAGLGNAEEYGRRIASIKIRVADDVVSQMVETRLV